MKINILVLLIIFVVKSAYTQTSENSLKKINIGDSLPNYTLTNLINFPAKSTKLTSFKGRLLILDFWTFGCTACVASWPKLVKLQEKFKDKVQIVLVNIYDKPEGVLTFVKRQEKILGYKMTLPIACGDKNLKVLFPHETVPHVVWVNNTGIVKYVTNGAYLNEETVDSIIAENEISMAEKTDDYPTVDRTRPLFINGNIANKEIGANVVWSSVINPYSPNILPVTTFGRYKGNSYGWISNYSAKDSFRVLYGKGPDLLTAVPNSLIQFKNIDSTGLVQKVNGAFRPQNCFVMQFTTKKEMAVQQIKNKMIKDLETYFQVATRWETQQKKCLVISRNKNPITIFKTGETLLNISDTGVDINNVSLVDLIDRLLVTNFYYLGYPIVNESNFVEKLGAIRFQTSKKMDYLSLSKALAKHGFEITLEDREIAVLTINSIE